jgi:hypothetical protein
MRVLFLTHRLPYAPNRGDRILAYHLLRALAAERRAPRVVRPRSRRSGSRRQPAGLARSVTAIAVAQRASRQPHRVGGDRPLRTRCCTARRWRPHCRTLVSFVQPDVVVA